MFGPTRKILPTLRKLPGAGNPAYLPPPSVTKKTSFITSTPGQNILDDQKPERENNP